MSCGAFDDIAQCETLRKIATLTFPKYKGNKLSIEMADQIDRSTENAADAHYSDWLVDLAHIEDAGPNLDEKGTRSILPLSSAVPILPGQSAQITARAQSEFHCKRFVISSAGTPGGAADWIVNDIRIGNRSQFTHPDLVYVPGEHFATSAIDPHVAFEPVREAMDVVVIVTYIGTIEEGAPFFASMIGIIGETSPQYVRVLQPNLLNRKALSTKIPLGFAYVSQRISVDENSTDNSITIYVPPIDQATIDVAVDAMLTAGKPTQAIDMMIEHALRTDHAGRVRGTRGDGLVHDAYVAFIMQRARALSAGEAGEAQTDP